MTGNLGVAVGLSVGCVLVAAGWNVLSRNGQPSLEAMAIGFDLFLGAFALQIGFIPGSASTQVPLRWIGVFVLFVLPLVMAVFMRFFGYRDIGGGRWEMKNKTVVLTSIFGGLAVPACYLVNAHATQVIHLWKQI